MNKKLFIGIGLFWLLIIFGFIGYKEMALHTGTEVLLKTVPVDPRDLFRGDYVILNYDISQVDIDIDKDILGQGQTLYVSLNNEEKYATAEEVSLDKPNGLFIKGKFVESWRNSIEYGIESYFVPEGKGWHLERNRGNMDVLVVIDSSGNAVIKEVLINDQPIDFSTIEKR